MKSFTRVLIIIAVFALAMGAIYEAVSASGVGAGAPAFERRPAFAPNGEQSAFEDTGFPNGEGPREFGEREEGRGGGAGWILSLTKNISIVAVLVAVITTLRNLSLRRRRQVVSPPGAA